MQVHDISEMASRAEQIGRGARLTQLHPHRATEDALLAVDLLEIEPGGSTPLSAHAEEHVLFVIAGTGEVSGASAGGTTVVVRSNSVVHIGHREVHSIRNTGGEVLRVLISTPLLVRSERALGLTMHGSTVAMPTEERKESPAEPAPRRVRETQPEKAPAPTEEPPASPIAVAPDYEGAEPLPDISNLVKKASQVAPVPRSEQRKPAPKPEPEVEPARMPAQEEEEEEPSNLMELEVVFDGGSRGNPGEGYGSFMVQSPGRKPVIKRLEFGGNYTNNQAEYDSLIECLKYIIERLEATNRSPDQMQLDIKTDSDLVANQLTGTYKVKDAGLRARHAQAIDLLDRFAAWVITWQPRAETVKLLGH